MAKVFIGSAGRMIPLVHEIARCLKASGHEPLPWTDTFEHGDITFERLSAVSREVNGAILVFSGDDKLENGYFQPRPNVLIEFGMFATCLGRKRAIVGRFGDHPFPSDLVGLTYLDLGTRLDSLSNEVRDRLLTWAAGLTRDCDPMSPEVGIVHVYSSFPLAKFCHELKRASRCIHILQTFIPYPQHMLQFEQDILGAIRRGCEVQVLLLDPRSQVVGWRQRTLSPGYGRDSVRQQILSNIEQLARLRAELPREARDRLELRVYDMMPSMSIYRVDDLFLAGYYFHAHLAIDSPQQQVPLQSVTGQRLAAEHDQLWAADITESVDLDHLDRWLTSGSSGARRMTRPRLPGDLARIDELEDQLIASFQHHPVLAAAGAMTRDALLELLLQRRFLSLAFTPIYELALDALIDVRARHVVRSLLRAEYGGDDDDDLGEFPADDRPTHRERLVLDLCALGATRRQIACSRPSQATRTVVEGLLAAMVRGPDTGEDAHQIAILSTLRLAAEILVAVEYAALWPHLQRLGLSADGRPGTKRSLFYHPHMVHDARTIRLSGPPSAPLDAGHSDQLTACLHALLAASGAGGLETSLHAMTYAHALKRSFYDPWLAAVR
jgi:hypothetical protein